MAMASTASLLARSTMRAIFGDEKLTISTDSPKTRVSSAVFV
jgi:hypothetical protein